MAYLNSETKDVYYKIIIAGPPSSGKTSNFLSIYNEISSKDSGCKLSYESKQLFQEDQYLEFFPVAFNIKEYEKVRFHLYSMPVQKDFDVLSRMLLKGVDGVLFVFDSRIDYMLENTESLNYMNNLFLEEGVDRGRLAQVYQYNKRDLSEIAPVDLMKDLLNKDQHPEVEASAINNKGPVDSLLLLINQILNLDFIKK